MASSLNTSTKPLAKGEESETSLSEYIYNQFETIVTHNSQPHAHPDQKIQVAKNYTDFIRQSNAETPYKDELFSPIISDTHLTILKEPEHIVTSEQMINSGIQLPVIDWSSQFRKGYSVLMWVRFHRHDASANTAASNDNEEHDPWAESMNPKPQILYRFATDASSTASGIQATLQSDSTSNSNKDFITAFLRVESLRSQAASKADTSSSMHNTSFMTHLAIPVGKWTLIGVQHSFPYLKPPILTVAMDGVEVGKGEVSYPTLGNDNGFMKDNFLLCNIPNNGQNGSVSIDSVDFAGFGLYKENIPTLIQGIVAEHGPSTNADGVLPAVPPVVQNRDAVMTNIERIAMYKKGSGGKGPFGLSSNRSKAGMISSRGIGIPLSIGVLLSSDGNHQGEVLLQRLLCKLVLGINVSKAVEVGGGRVIIPVNIGASVGMTGDVHKVGVVQPREPATENSTASTPPRRKVTRRKNSSQADMLDDNTTIAKCGGNIRIFNATHEFLIQEKTINSKVGTLPVPSYSLPNSILPQERPIPSFLDTYFTTDTFGFILQIFHLSLPPPGFAHKLQTKYYKESFDYLYDLIVYKDGQLAANLIELFAANLSLGGRAKEEVLHSGAIHSMATLLRRVLLRASRLNMFSMKNCEERKMDLWKIYEGKENPEDELRDIHALNQSAPTYVPPLITKACCKLIDNCCGLPQALGRRWKRPVLPLHIRRSSDIALTSIFGFSLDLDLWGSDLSACSLILKEVSDRYCSDGFLSDQSSELVHKFDSGYGRLLRNEMSVQHLLDLIRIRFGEEIILSKDSDPGFFASKMSISTSLSHLLYMMLKYSLSSKKTLSQGEHDVTAAVNALSDCQLGSIAAHSILTALNDILVYCETFPAIKTNPDRSLNNGLVSVLHVNKNSGHKQRNSEANERLKKIKTDIWARLGRNLIVAEFHDVVAPLLISRTIFTGSSEGNSSVEIKETDLELYNFHWQYHWRLVLRLFVWVVSLYGPEGEKAAKQAGGLLIQSGQAGSLNDCFLTKDCAEILQLFLPPLQTPTSAVPSVSASATMDLVKTHLSELSYRLRIMFLLSGGLVAGLLAMNKSETIHVTKTALDVISMIVMCLKNLTFYLLEKDIGLMSRQRPIGNRRNQASAVIDRPEVRTAVELVPQLVVTLLTLEMKLQSYRDFQQTSDLDTWDLVDESSNGSTISIDEQKAILLSSQQDLLVLAATLITRCMMCGGGEASTSVWRTILSVCDTNSSDSSAQNKSLINGEANVGKQTQLSSRANTLVRTNVLCRLIALTLNMVVNREGEGSNPWTTIELCSSVARLCDLIEEKGLLEAMSEVDEISTLRLTLDQVQLLQALLKILGAGRENTGWCQLDLPRPPSMQSPDKNVDKGKDDQTYIQTLQEHCENLIANLVENSKPSLENTNDLQMLAEKDEIYQMTSSAKNAISLVASKPIPATSIPDTISTSKMLLPILQPTLRVVLACLRHIRGTSILVHQLDSLDGVQETDSLLSVVVQELSSSLVAAVVGLAFSNARDVCLNTLSILRKSVKCKDSMEDTSASLIFRTLFLTIANEMKIRYDGERIKRETAKLKAYSRDDDPDLDSEQEAANANEVEALLIGNALTAKTSGDHHHSDSASVSNQSGVEDFIVFPDDMELERENKSFSSPRGSSTLGWSNYKGFGKSLEKCCQDEDGIVDVKDISDRAFHLLSRYLDAWDENQLLDEEESELVELFDTKTSLDRYFDTNRGNLVQSGDAADSMTSYIELASAESGRRDEIQTNIYPFKRYNNISFVEKQAWRKFMELKESSFRDMFERCMADGGRDYGARMVTIPTHPQFPRTIPKQLDHTVGVNSFDGDDEQGFEQLNSLVQQGTLKIFDITKKENKSELEIEEDNDSLDGSNVLVSKPSANADLLEDFHDSEDGFLDFPSSERPEKEQDSNDKSDATSGQENAAVEDHVKEEVQQEGISMDVDLMDSDDLQHEFVMSTFANPPNISSTTLQGNIRHAHIPNTQINAGDTLVEIEYENCVHIRPEGNRKGTLFVTPTHLFLEYSDASGLYEGEQMAIDELKKKLDCDDDDNEKLSNELEYERIIQHYKKEAAKRPKSIRWNIYEISHIYLRRYRLRDSAIEIFFMPTGGDIFGGPGLSSAMNSVLIDFGPGREGNEDRDDAANVIMARAPTSTIKQWPEKSAQFLHEHLRNITIGWVKGRIGNFDYLLALNCLSGRSFNDLCQYPVFPWVLSNYRSDEVPNLNDKNNFRDLTKPMGALNPGRLQEFIERFETFDDPIIPPFMYGSHYSTSAGVVLHFLVRMHPFASLHRQLQSGHFDVADRLFSSVPRTWDMVTGQSASEVKELTPEWYCNPAFLRNSNQFKLGTSQDGETLGDVELPPWAKGSPERFVEVMRCALESEVCTSMLPHWIDLIFGRKQQGPDAVEAYNVFFYLTYYGSVDVASIEDEDLRIATELQIAHFGQCPMQLFWRPHVHKLVKSNPRRKLTLSEMLGVFDFGSIDPNNSHRQLPFESAPISHWVHLFAPPPGPHAPLISVRFVFPDRCIAIDALGIFHFFRWTWKADTEQAEERPRRNVDLFEDRGYFVATRELPHFRSVPRLSFECPRPKDWLTKKNIAVVAISRCLFSLRLLLVVSDGDGKGGITFQLVDPSKCTIQGEVQVRSAHSSKISAIHMDPIGTAAGVGGAAGEVAVIGSEDGTVTLWRFISTPSCNLPLRPRLKFGGHKGQKIRSVVVNTSLNLCATVSAFRCTIFNITNGTMLRSISPPNDNIAEVTGIQIGSGVNCETCFADSNSICVTSSGYLVLVCVSKFWSDSGDFKRDVVTLQLFTLDGRHIGAKALETWRGIPNKISQTFDGKAVMVCSGRGVSFHLISAIKPLAFIDEWQIGEDEEDVVSAYDIDFGPSPSRPVVAATCLSSGALRLHALKGISDWSEDHKKGSVTEAVGNVIGTVKGTGSKMVGLVKGTGSRVFGLGREIGREAIGDVASKGAGLLGGLGLKMNPER